MSQLAKGARHTIIRCRLRLANYDCPLSPSCAVPPLSSGLATPAFCISILTVPLYLLCSEWHQLYVSPDGSLSQQTQCTLLCPAPLTPALLCSAVSGTYYVPPDGPLDSYRDYLRGLPTTEAPEVFGMHTNANISFQLQETRRLVDAILSIQPRVSGTSRWDWEGLRTHSLSGKA